MFKDEDTIIYNGEMPIQEFIDAMNSLAVKYPTSKVNICGEPSIMYIYADIDPTGETEPVIVLDNVDLED